MQVDQQSILGGVGTTEQHCRVSLTAPKPCCVTSAILHAPSEPVDNFGEGWSEERPGAHWPGLCPRGFHCQWSPWALVGTGCGAPREVRASPAPSCLPRGLPGVVQSHLPPPAAFSLFTAWFCLALLRSWNVQSVK